MCLYVSHHSSAEDSSPELEDQDLETEIGTFLQWRRGVFSCFPQGCEQDKAGFPANSQLEPQNT